MKFFILTSLVVAIAIAAIGVNPVPDSELKNTFLEWKEKYAELMTIEQEVEAFATWVENLRKIEEHNAKPDQTYTMGMNQFGAMTPDQFKMYIHGSMGSCLNASRPEPTHTYDPSLAFVNVPTSVDWSQKTCGSGACVTPVKNQGSCGSCWAFSTTGSIEARTAIATGRLVSLSEQQLVDCSGRYGNNGCKGGLMDRAFQYVRDNGGLCSEAEYGYTAKQGSCRSCSQRYDTVKGYVDVSRASEEAMKAAVAAGPVSIAIEADQYAFQFYSGGVLSGSCGNRLDHGVLIVGYGTQNGQDYWKVKNSWGPSWGSQGYILLCRNCNKNSGQGECGILDSGSYPTV